MKEQVKEREAALAEAATEVAELETQAAARKQEYEEAKQDLDNRRLRISECEKQIVKLTRARNSAVKKAEKADLEAKRVAHKVARMEKDSAAAARLIEALLAKFPWIESVSPAADAVVLPSICVDAVMPVRCCFRRSIFLASRSLNMTSVDGVQKLLGKNWLSFTRNRTSTTVCTIFLSYECTHSSPFSPCRLSKKINKKVMSMFEKAEQEYQDLKQRKSIIENDKDKIEKVIGELDAKKNETLKKTWAKVNRDFGSIFSTLLPGANAKLEPEEGKTVSQLSQLNEM
eukprot:COSAG02_NODE_4358_length_5457_cov_2.064390_8_plen_287_part_00